MKRSITTLGRTAGSHRRRYLSIFGQSILILVGLSVLVVLTWPDLPS